MRQTDFPVRFVGRCRSGKCDGLVVGFTCLRLQKIRTASSSSSFNIELGDALSAQQLEYSSLAGMTVTGWAQVRRTA